MTYENTNLTIGIDSEYQLKNEKYDNRVISFQLYVVETKQEVFIDLIAEKKTGITLEEIVKRIKEVYPLVHMITFVAHFSYAEISSLEDGRDLLIGNGRMIISQKTPHGSINKDKTDGVLCKLVDTYKLFPSLSSVEKIGDVIGIPKIKIDPYEKDDMLGLYYGDFELFKKYAVTDAVICGTAYAEMKSIVEAEGWKMGNTVGSIGEALIYDKLLDAVDKNPQAITGLGFKTHYKRIEIKQDGKSTVTRKKTPQIVLDKAVDKFEHVMYGGRNETYSRELLSTDTPVYDYDLTSAYTTLQSICPIWDTTYHQTFTNPKKCYEYLIQNPLAHGVIYIGFARHKRGIKFPIVLGKNANNIFFTLQGERIWLTAKEFMVAYPDLVFEGGTFDAKIYRAIGESSVISDFTQTIRMSRRKCPKGTLGNSVFKDIGNSCYGKMYQGYADKRGVDLANSSVDYILSKPVPTSRISNPMLSTWITGGIRALSYEILNELHRMDIEPLYWTTDGFATTDIIPNDVFNGNCGVWSKYVAYRLKQYDEKGLLLETKHYGNGWLSLKTRGYMMLQERSITDEDEARRLKLKPVEKYDRLVSISGIQKKGKSKDMRINIILDNLNIMERFKKTQFEKETITPIRYWLRGEEYGNIISMQSFNFDWDFKRKPINYKVVNVHGFDYVTFDTVPFKDEKEYLLYSMGYFDFLQERGYINKLLTIEHYLNFEEYIALKNLNLVSRININTPLRILANFCIFKLGMSERKTATILNTTRTIVNKAAKEEWVMDKPVEAALLIEKWFNRKIEHGEKRRPKKKDILVLNKKIIKARDILTLQQVVELFQDYLKNYKISNLKKAS